MTKEQAFNQMLESTDPRVDGKKGRWFDVQHMRRAFEAGIEHAGPADHVLPSQHKQQAARLSSRLEGTRVRGCWYENDGAGNYLVLDFGETLMRIKFDGLFGFGLEDRTPLQIARDRLTAALAAPDHRCSCEAGAICPLGMSGLRCTAVDLWDFIRQWDTNEYADPS